MNAEERLLGKNADGGEGDENEDEAEIAHTTTRIALALCVANLRPKRIGILSEAKDLWIVPAAAKCRGPSLRSG
jgi:hypothetical protein